MRRTPIRSIRKRIMTQAIRSAGATDESNDRRPSPVETSDAERIDEALASVPQHAFYGEGGDTLAGAIGRSMPSASALRRLIVEAGLRPGMRVLQVGTGSGYAAAVLAHIGAEVFTIERVRDLVELARTRLATLGYRDVRVKEGNGFDGWAEYAPFDAIIVSARGPSDLKALKSQLKIGGVLVGASGNDRHQQRLYRLRRINVQTCTKEDLGDISTASDIGEIMDAMEPANRKLVATARELALEHGTRLEDEIRNAAGEDASEFYRALAIERGMHFGSADALVKEIEPLAFEGIPRAFLLRNSFVPIRVEDGVAVVATSDPDASASEVRKALQSTRVQLCLVTPADLRRLLSTFDLAHHESDESAGDAARSSESRNLSRGQEYAPDAYYVNLLDSMLLDAVAERASDLHLERYAEQVVVRIRVDGDLREINSYRLTPADLERLINVIKIEADLDISERRLPQGGRASFTTSGRKYDLRVQTQPCLYGEHAVIRLLPQEARLLGIEELGFPGEVAARYRRLLGEPAGLVLVVGPTGSGKSTTLYAGLGELAADKRRKVITVEDPVEYAISGVQQTQVRPEVGFHFSDAMRAFVREDPDVILVGEIRDRETALEAIRAAQTGHLVLSTLHCNDAVDAVQRLFDLGMHPNSIASELLAVVAQRLAKRLCEHCREPGVPEPEIAAEVFPGGVPDGFRCYTAPGCKHCRGEGTRGRVAVIEYLRVSGPVRAAITRALPLDELRSLALAAGMMTMRESALRQVAAGVIGFAELPRILPAERLRAE
jgi:type IV pilus assembly protein PilB